MDVRTALASLAVSDLDTSVAWYEQLLGPGTNPLAGVCEWKLEGGGVLQVYRGPERAGHGSCTLIVDDVAAVADELRRLGIADVEPVVTDFVDTVMIQDPDGNSIAFSHPKAPTLAR